MLTLEEEKKLVAEKLMGWEISYITPDTIINPKFKHKITKYPEGERLIMINNSPKYYLTNWNPQLERKWWDEIWEKIGNTLEIYDYLQNLESALGLTAKSEHTEGIFKFHTAKPEICWKALIKTLKEKI